MQEKTYQATVENLPAATDYISEGLLAAGAGEAVIMQITLAFEEIFVNIAKYAYPKGSGIVTVAINSEDKTFTLITKDNGLRFDPLQKDDPDYNYIADENTMGGLGIFMVKKIMDTVSYEYKDGQNILTMTKKIS